MRFIYALRHSDVITYYNTIIITTVSLSKAKV